MFEQFRVLMVCTGNICRSPIAAQVLREGLWDVHELSIRSAGVAALEGDQMTEQAKAISRHNGGNPIAHVAHRLDADDVREADLLLTMTREQRAAVVRMVPAASRRVFTLREFARLEAVVDQRKLDAAVAQHGDNAMERFAAAVDLVASRRGFLPLLDNPNEDDVVDPYGRSDATYARSAAQLLPAVESVRALLRAAVGRAFVPAGD